MSEYDLCVDMGNGNERVRIMGVESVKDFQSALRTQLFIPDGTDFRVEVKDVEFDTWVSPGENLEWLPAKAVVRLRYKQKWGKRGATIGQQLGKSVVKVWQQCGKSCAKVGQQWGNNWASAGRMQKLGKSYAKVGQQLGKR